jgi:hypothetical protein
MFLVLNTFFFDESYIIQADFYTKFFICIFGILLFLEVLRRQISEIDLLQLIPGFYFFIFFLCLLFLISLSEIIFRLPLEIDKLTLSGTRITDKMRVQILFKFSVILFSIILGISLCTIVPLSLDSFNFSGEKTLENTWSLDEVVILQLLLLILLIIISQFPLFFVISFNTQKMINFLSKIWKFLIFGITIIAGFLTPTLDGFTQISFASSTFSFYLLIVNFLQKRVFLKFNIFLPFGN